MVEPLTDDGGAEAVGGGLQGSHVIPARKALSSFLKPILPRVSSRSMKE